MKPIILFLFILISSLHFIIIPAADATDLKLGWYPNPESNISGYKVYCGTESHNYSTILDIGNPPLINGLVTATVTDLIPLTTYYFSLTSYNDIGLSSDLCPELIWTCQFSYNSDIFVNPEYDDISLNCFPTINQGYLAAHEFDDIYISADTYYEDLNFNQPKQINLSAGWEDNFHLNSSCTTTLQGTLTISAGTITIDSLILGSGLAN